MEQVHHSLNIVFPQNEHSQVLATTGFGCSTVVLPALFLVDPLTGLDVRSTTALERVLLLISVLLLAARMMGKALLALGGRSGSHASQARKADGLCSVQVSHDQSSTSGEASVILGF